MFSLFSYGRSRQRRVNGHEGLHHNCRSRDHPRKQRNLSTVLTEHNEGEFRLKATKPAKDFNPVVGATIPKGIKAQSLPMAVLSQMSELRNYMYVKMKDQVLIVNGMTDEIVDMFPETQPLS
jgi:hypothetical protein